MLSVNTNITSLLVQNHFSIANNTLKTSLERMSTGFKINRASDDAANLAVSKNMECQISGTNIAADNVQQGVNLVQTADGALGEMQDIAQRMRELCLQSMNGTYSDEERAMMNEEIKSLTNEIYQQRNNAKFNEISIFGAEEQSPFEPPRHAELVSASQSAQGTTATQGAFDPTHVYKTDADAIKAGYAADHLIHNEAELQNIIDTQAKHYHYDTGWGTVYDYDYLEGDYCLMGDIDFNKISGSDNMCLGCYDYEFWSVTSTGDFNGNGYTIKNLSGSQGLFSEVSGSVENLKLENVNINSDKENVGALAGQLQDGSTITNCSISGSVTGTGSTSASGTGGLVGQAYGGTITNCSSSGDVTGTYYTGGLVGYTFGTITNCSVSGRVTGTGIYTGGLVGMNDGTTIDKSYATGDVTGGDNVGGIVGCSMGESSVISNSYALGNIEGDGYIGGAVGSLWMLATVQNSYSTGTVTGKTEGCCTGGFIAMPETGSVSNCYSIANMQFSDVDGYFTNCHGTKAQDGVEAHDKSWFENGDNLKPILGDAFNTGRIPPDIIGNERPPDKEGIQFQIGADSGQEYTLKIDTEFSLKGFSADVSTRESAEASLKKIDALLSEFSTRRAEYGATQNRLESVASSLMTKTNNLSASHSTIVDTDFAAESANFIKAQILQNATSALLAQANTNPNIALTLL